MKTSLGIWAFGPIITRFVAVGYQPEHSYDPRRRNRAPRRPHRAGS